MKLLGSAPLGAPDGARYLGFVPDKKNMLRNWDRTGEEIVTRVCTPYWLGVRNNVGLTQKDRVSVGACPYRIA